MNPTLLRLFAAFFAVALGNTWAQESKLPRCPTGTSKFWTNCYGTLTFSSGDTYVGEFKDDKISGQGTYTYADGNKYVGEFKDGKRNGRGSFYFIGPKAGESSDADQPAPTKRKPSEIEVAAWGAAKEANSKEGYPAFLEGFPKGRFSSAARVARAALPIPSAQVSAEGPEERWKVYLASVERVVQEREAKERERAEQEARETARQAQEIKHAEEQARVTEQEREKAEREKAERERLEREKAERERLERERLDRAERAERERAERAERDRLERERIERDRAERAKAEREAAEQRRKNNIDRDIARSQAEAGEGSRPSTGGGSSGASGGGSSSSRNNEWQVRVKSAIRENTTFVAPPDMTGNPQVVFRVTLSPDCALIRVDRINSSGVPSWDQAAERAVRKTNPFPRFPSGQCPSSFELTSRPLASE